MEPVVAPTTASGDTLSNAVRRGAWLGLKWANVVAVVGAGIALLALVGVEIFVAIYAGLGALLDDRGLLVLLRGLGGIVGFYVTTCGWGVVIGVIASVASLCFRRIRQDKTGNS